MLEEKVFVITSMRWKQLEAIVLQDPDYRKIKQSGMCSYYWIDNDKGYEQNARHIHELIDRDPMGSITMFQLCPVLNGKRDLFSNRKSREQKRKMDYFRTHHYDITEKELQMFAKHNDIHPRYFSDQAVVLSCIDLK